MNTMRAPLLLVVPAVLVALYGLATLAVPGVGAPFLVDRFATLHIPTVAHILTGPLALAAGALQFSERLRATRPRVHRALGWAYAVSVLVSGVGGLLMARLSEGGQVTHWGFGLLGAGWLLTTGCAIRAITRGAVDAHRRWMTRSYALTFAAVTLRVLLPLGLAAGVAFETVYRVVSWAAWVPNLLVVEWRLRHGR